MMLCSNPPPRPEAEGEGEVAEAAGAEEAKVEVEAGAAAAATALGGPSFAFSFARLRSAARDVGASAARGSSFFCFWSCRSCHPCSAWLTRGRESRSCHGEEALFLIGRQLDVEEDDWTLAEASCEPIPSVFRSHEVKVDMLFDSPVPLLLLAKERLVLPGKRTEETCVVDGDDGYRCIESHPSLASDAAPAALGLLDRASSAPEALLISRAIGKEKRRGGRGGGESLFELN